MMWKRLWALLLTMICLCSAAQAGGASGSGKDAQLPAQQGPYSPRYSVSATFEVLPGKAFELVVYEDSGTLPLLAVRNGGGVPAGVSFATRTQEGVRQACITGTVMAEGAYGFSMLIREEGENGAQSTLAILHVTLRITADAPVIDPYLGDGQGMVRVVMDGVNLRRTPGGKRLGLYDEDTRFVWCTTQKKGGYTWYRVWTADYGYGWIRGDMLQVEPPMRIVYTPGRETSFPLFITPGTAGEVTPNLIMTQEPDVIGFDTGSLTTHVQDGATWTMLSFSIDASVTFFIQVDLRDEAGAPLECQLVYITPEWEDVPEYVEQ